MASLEFAAQQAFVALQLGSTTPLDDGCKVSLHRWQCFQFFPQCLGSTQTVMQICSTTCLFLAKTCGFAWLDCEVEYEEMRRVAPLHWYDKSSGRYIRGVKPLNKSVWDSTRPPWKLGVNGVLGQGPVFGDKPCTSAGGRAQPTFAFIALACGAAVLLTLL